jgi:hypothetical protein
VTALTRELIEEAMAGGADLDITAVGRRYRRVIDPPRTVGSVAAATPTRGAR